MRARAITTLLTMLSTGPFAPFWCMEVAGDLNGLERAFDAGLWYGLARVFWGPCWPDLGPCWGLCVWLAMLARAQAGLGCLFSLYEYTALCGYTVSKGYDIAYD